MEQAILIICRRDWGCLARKTADLSEGLYPRIAYASGDSPETVKERVRMETGLNIDVDMSIANDICFLSESSQRALPHLFALYSRQQQGSIDQKKHRWIDLRKVPLSYAHYAPDKGTWEQDAHASGTGLQALGNILRREREKWDYSRASSDHVDTLRQLCFDVCVQVHAILMAPADCVSIEDEILDDYLYRGYLDYRSGRLTDESIDAKTAAIDELLATGPVTEELTQHLEQMVCLLAARAREFMLDGEVDKFRRDMKSARYYLTHITSILNEPVLVQRARKGGQAKARKMQAADAQLARIRAVVESVVRNDRGSRKNENNSHATVRLMPRVLETLKKRRP